MKKKASADKQAPSPRRLYAETQDEIAQCLNVTRRSVTNFLSEGMPGKTSRGYDVGDCVGWYFLQLAMGKKPHPNR